MAISSPFYINKCTENYILYKSKIYDLHHLNKDIDLILTIYACQLPTSELLHHIFKTITIGGNNAQNTDKYIHPFKRGQKALHIKYISI